MKRTLFILSLILICVSSSFANHITGGEMFYKVDSVLPNGNYVYRITLKLYRDCFSTGAELDDNAAIAIFERTANGGYRQILVNSSVPQRQIIRQNLDDPDPCITNPPRVCYQVGYYEFTVELPPSLYGYIASYQRCCRIGGITNVVGSNNVGATYTADIPGSSVVATAPDNNSAQFLGEDLVIVCSGNYFQYDFSAQDEDGDDLVYSFCSAYPGASASAPRPTTPSAPPYSPVPYSFPYNAGQPLGTGVTLNTKTGMVTGIAPSAGIYVVTVCVTEYRNGKPIATQRKDLQIKVADCTVAAATLDPEYITCDGLTWNFSNLSNSTLIQKYFWDFGTGDTSNLPKPTYTFPAAGEYTVKLATNRGLECPDSATTLMKVYPGFFPAFTTQGICLNKPVQFTDQTTTNYGVVDTWTWNFDDNSPPEISQNPTHSFSSIDSFRIRLIVTNSKGCIDTAFQTISIVDKPPINFGFRDTLICSADNIQLQASGQGVFSWTPTATIISGANTGTPLVDPPTTTTYNVTLNEQGCVNTDSVRVRVVDFVSLNAMPDSTICQGDSIVLRAQTDGLAFNWTSLGTGGTVLNPTELFATVVTNATTDYELRANIGSCFATDRVRISPVPYPIANAGLDTIICYGSTAQLRGSSDGSSFTWSPANTLINADTYNPIAQPIQLSTAYVLSAFDTKGCPKPGRDTVVVTMLPEIIPFAGNDTAVVVGQPLQLEATGGVNYLWTPGTGLSATDIPNPTGLYDGSLDSISYKVLVFNEAGCADSTTLLVKIFNTNPQIFVPTGFTPNGDGLNDLVRPIAVGIKQFQYFRIFNRWGELVFETRQNGKGWDGTIAGQLQGTNTYVWICSGVDYLDRPFFAKGTVTLMR